MDNRELARTKCLDNMAAFGKNHATDLADAATDSAGKKKARAKARRKFAELVALNIAIGKEVAKQQSGGKTMGTTNRGVLRDALIGDLREWNRTAAGLADELKRPEIMDGFRMPHGNNDEELAGRARAFITAVGELGLHDAFVESGLEDDFEDALDERIIEFKGSQEGQSTAGQKSMWSDVSESQANASQEGQSTAGQKSSGAGVSLEELIRTGMSTRKSLDALVHNLFKGNATIIGEWAAASHVERQGSRKRKPGEPDDGTSPAPSK